MASSKRITRVKRQKKTSSVRQPDPSQNQVVGLSSADLAEQFEDLGASCGFAPKDFYSTRRLILGQRRFGKSTLFAGQKYTAYIDMDGGSVNRPMGEGSVRFPVRNWRQLKRVEERFKKLGAKGQFPFRHVAFDTIDTMRNLVREMLTHEKSCDDIVEYGREGKGYDLMTYRLMSYFWMCEKDLGVGWSALGHLKYRRNLMTATGKETADWGPAVHAGFADNLAQEADMILEVKRETVKAAPKRGEVRKYLRRFVLVATTPLDRPWLTHELGTRIPFNTSLVIPKANGIDEVEEAYEIAVEAERTRWEESTFNDDESGEFAGALAAQNDTDEE